ncbi:hypothetical protein K466DRAFT_586079 [Polyporus arcularius HHB13444]|uniref:Uncharacterized protein n=1 Tax=Polyporus arcularius HHB13444 TaxID=1314778 RepID=A0A5C3PEX8_9APHY|nr:hypothetical protein K466DRAFT_586079 [Polyporus arcularius HHB13444]
MGARHKVPSPTIYELDGGEVDLGVRVDGSERAAARADSPDGRAEDQANARHVEAHVGLVDRGERVGTPLPKVGPPTSHGKVVWRVTVLGSASTEEAARPTTRREENMLCFNVFGGVEGEERRWWSQKTEGG